MNDHIEGAHDSMGETIPVPENFPTLAEIAEARSMAPGMNPHAHYVLHILITVSRSLETALDNNMVDYGLTMGRYVVLARIYQAGRGGITTSRLAEVLQVTRATMTGLLDALERDGLVERLRRDDDKRRIDVRATSKAKAYLRRIVPDHCDRVGKMFESFSVAELKTLARLLIKLDASKSHLLRDS